MHSFVSVSMLIIFVFYSQAMKRLAEFFSQSNISFTEKSLKSDLEDINSLEESPFVSIDFQ